MHTKLTHRPTVLIDKKRLLEIIPFSERTIFDLEKKGAFPRRIALSSRKVVWDLAEILEWLDARKKGGPAPRPGMGA
ncbi:helix-turn-helix transcriptional regulator [Klebsiella pneumoniae]|uniref:helix-turn-helix transcriptional regulator n=1 Tax=Klebsiella pneumoniae complex TaxID=3390273 RepID=UPI000E2AB44B|nr:AlpA family phage regulatory protein [Klebsiella variicola]ECC8752261.1 DNA-binding protein [Salmonella enterica subsp. diarizonae]EKU2005559.1 AlpA family phage regulatory protein [Klebsiella pneumoniae]HAX2659720.1 AlpA family phage regulatory protein [Escherichia coli]EKW4018393.1 AlpA family phage regulatory protein [Klebsiella pneumoniae]EKW5549530.1 AlpA family phage regulatory protein [Klebsiella pneumoniae]